MKEARQTTPPKRSRQRSHEYPSQIAQRLRTLWNVNISSHTKFHTLRLQRISCAQKLNIRFLTLRGRCKKLALGNADAHQAQNPTNG